MHHRILGLVESAWFFRRGTQSLRIVRIDHHDSTLTLLVDGPGASHVVHRFDDRMACALQQCEIERQLIAKGFFLERSSRAARRPAWRPMPPPAPQPPLAA